MFVRARRDEIPSIRLGKPITQSHNITKSTPDLELLIAKFRDIGASDDKICDICVSPRNKRSGNLVVLLLRL
jgi:hypothetical protein